MYRSVEPDIRYQFFNMKDPVIGGYSPEKIALRRAIIMGFDVKVADKGGPEATIGAAKFALASASLFWTD